MKTFVGIDLGSTTTKAVLLDENERGDRPRHHEFPLELLDRRVGWRARRRPSTPASPCSAARSRPAAARASISTRSSPRWSGLPSRAVPRAAGRPRGDLPRPGEGRSLRQGRERRPGRDRRGAHAPARGGAVALAARARAGASRTSSATSPDRAITPMREGSRRSARPALDPPVNVYDKSIIDVENRPPSGSGSSEHFAARSRACWRQTA